MFTHDSSSVALDLHKIRQSLPGDSQLNSRCVQTAQQFAQRRRRAATESVRVPATQHNRFTGCLSEIFFFLCLQFIEICWVQIINFLQATVLEEMPAFPERESSILAVLKKKKPGRVPENEIRENRSPAPNANHAEAPSAVAPVVNNSSADLLGLSTPPSSQPTSNTGVLLDVLGDIYNMPNKVGATNGTSPNAYNPKKFVCKNNGVLFENDLIQIGVKSEFRQNLGRIGLFYGNKTQSALHSFQTQLSWSDDNQTKLAVQMKPVDPSLEAGAQIQQMINAECIDDYNGKRETREIIRNN